MASHASPNWLAVTIRETSSPSEGAVLDAPRLWLVER